MRRSVTAPLIFLACVAAVVAGWRIFADTEAARYRQTQAVARSRSEIVLHFAVTHARGPIQREEYRMTDIDGRSSARYSATNRKGVTVDVDAPIVGYDVSFFFDRVVADGIWELPDRPPRGKLDDRYSVGISQVAQNKRGNHTFAFTDPHYWATTGGRQYRIHLDPKKPTPDLVSLAGTTLIEPRYEKIVADFRAFGSPHFREIVASVVARLRAGS